MLRKDGTFIVFALFFMFNCDTTTSECTQLTACSCMLANGQGYDLSPLSNSGPLMANGQNSTLYFHPCKNIVLTNNTTSECYKGVSLCGQYGNETFSLGKVEDTKFEVSASSTKQPMLTLHHGNRISTISLVCCNDCKTQLVIDFTNATRFHLLLLSPYSCKVPLHTKGLSTGSILVILFFVFSGIYFVGGAIALKVLRGATGKEMLPNHEFWCELPSLVKDGIIFTFNCFRADSYERI